MHSKLITFIERKHVYIENKIHDIFCQEILSTYTLTKMEQKVISETREMVLGSILPENSKFHRKC